MLPVWTNLFPRRRSDRNNLGAVLLGAGIGIAVWEWFKKTGGREIDRETEELDRLADEVLKAAAGTDIRPPSSGEHP